MSENVAGASLERERNIDIAVNMFWDRYLRPEGAIYGNVDITL